MFTKVLILQYNDPKCHIWIKTDVLGYAIGKVLSHLTSDQMTLDSKSNLTKSDLSQWYPVAYFIKKMIVAKTCYETYNSELLAIVEAFKTWRYYLEGYKHEVFVLTDYNNLCRFMDTKSLSSRQVCWAQELSHYQF